MFRKSYHSEVLYKYVQPWCVWPDISVVTLHVTPKFSLQICKIAHFRKSTALSGHICSVSYRSRTTVANPHYHISGSERLGDNSSRIGGAEKFTIFVLSSSSQKRRKISRYCSLNSMQKKWKQFSEMLVFALVPNSRNQFRMQFHENIAWDMQQLQAAENRFYAAAYHKSMIMHRSVYMRMVKLHFHSLTMWVWVWFDSWAFDFTASENWWNSQLYRHDD